MDWIWGWVGPRTGLDVLMRQSLAPPEMKPRIAQRIFWKIYRLCYSVSISSCYKLIHTQFITKVKRNGNGRNRALTGGTSLLVKLCRFVEALKEPRSPMEVRGPQYGDYCSNEYPRPLTVGLCSYNSELQIFSSESYFVNVLNDREFHASRKG
jgi:hypothetical protein